MLATPGSWTCPKCSKEMLRKNLYSHLRMLHDCTADEVEQIKQQVKQEAAMFIAPEEEHVICPVCQERFHSHELLVEHCDQEHIDDEDDGNSQDFHVFTVHFANKEDFEIWLEEQQRRTTTSFVKRTSSHAGNEFNLRCNRAGKYIRKTGSKATQTKKEVSHCTCFLNVHIRDDGSVDAKGCLAHIGHKANPALLRLTFAQRQLIREMLEEYPHNYIIKCLRRDYPATSRLHFVTHGDLWDFVNRYGLRQGFRNKDDMQSLIIRQGENNPEDGIRLLEMPINRTGKDFRIIIITPQQVQWLKEFSHRGISIDDTHHPTRYNFKLATVMVLNERDSGMPAAFLLSGSMTTGDVERLFLEIRDLIPDFNPKWILTDEAPCFYNGFKSVFPDSTATLHYCRWHIDRTMQKNVNKLVDTRIRGQVRQMLKGLLLIADLSAFQRRFAEILAFLQTEGQQPMVEYLRRNYLGKTPTWASFSNVGAVMDTTMISERWHLRLKKEFLHRNANSRADFLVDLLIRAVKDLAESDEIKVGRRLARASSRRQETTVCHREAMKYYHSHTDKIVRLGASHWRVGDASGNCFEVQHTGECECNESNEQNVHCALCSVCPYVWTCTCPDRRAGVSCKHRHAVLLYGIPRLPENTETLIEEETSSTSEATPSIPEAAIPPAKSTAKVSGLMVTSPQQRREERAQLRSAICMNVSVMNTNVNALVNEDSDDAIDKLKEILDLTARASRIGLRSRSGIAVRPELTGTGAKPKLSKIPIYTRKQSRTSRMQKPSEHRLHDE